MIEKLLHFPVKMIIISYLRVSKKGFCELGVSSLWK